MLATATKSAEKVACSKCQVTVSRLRNTARLPHRHSRVDLCSSYTQLFSFYETFIFHLLWKLEKFSLANKRENNFFGRKKNRSEENYFFHGENRKSWLGAEKVLLRRENIFIVESEGRTSRNTVILWHIFVPFFTLRNNADWKLRNVSTVTTAITTISYL